MAVYAIGDVQGCYDPLRRLLDKMQFDADNDTLWFTGDLVNRGPASLETLRFVRSLGAAAITVLGNHDLHLLAAHFGGIRRNGNRDTLDPVLAAKDCEELLDWLRHRPLMHQDQKLNTVMVHAGLSPHWTIKQSLRQARKLEALIQGKKAARLLSDMYAKPPRRWSVSLTRWQRRHYALAVFTRLRFIDKKGRLEMSQKGPPGTQVAGTVPWFEVPQARWEHQSRIVFGHWSTLGETRRPDVIALDSGCVWGGCLTAAILKKKKPPRYIQVNCP